MAGRGRGRGTLNRWDPGFDGRAIASVTPLKKRTPATTSKMDELKLSSVRVTCIIDVNHFWAQLGSNSDLEHFDNYMFALNHWCDNQLPSTISEMPNVGQVVCVQHAASRMWRRAEVTRLSQRMVDVFFLDYGEAECVSLDMLCSNVPSDITSWPPQALYCTLNGVKPPKGEDQWSEKAVKRFRELVSFRQNLAASHGNENLELTLYLVDENGHMKSVGSILVEENLAQETSYKTSEEDAWPEVPQRSNKTENPALKNLDQLEQQLVMSGFSYLLNPCNEQKPDFTYETTTISSSYCTYKGNKEPPTVSSSSSIQNFAANKDRSPQSHLSTRPHLASPGEFMTSSKAPFGKEAVTGFLHEDSHPRQDASKSIPGNTDTSQHRPWFNTWSQHDWKWPQDKNKTLFGANDAYSSEGRTLADLSFKDPKSAGSTLQYHLDGPSAFHDPKYKQQQQVLGPFTVASQSGDVFRNPQQQQQAKESFTQPQLPTNNTKDKTMKTELSWQKWKFQRNIKKLLDKTQSEDVSVSDIGLEIGTLINNSKLSQTFEGVSEVMVVLEMITERVLEKIGFSSIAAKLCSALSGLDIPQFTRYMCEVITAIRDDLSEHQAISDWEERCERFCSFMGEMVVIAAGQECTDAKFKSVIDVLISQSLEKWITLDKVIDDKLDEFLICLIALLEIIGPVMEEHNLRFGNFDLETIFNIVRNHVLSEDIPRSAKSALLDLMLLRAAGWPEKPQEKEDVDDDDDNMSVEKEECKEDWDPYSKVSIMLEKLKLEDLFKKFKDNRIRDTLLVANKDEFKKTLQEACFPPGVILEIQMFLEKGEEIPERKRSTSSNKGFPLPARNTTSRKHSHSEHHSQNTEKLEKPVYHEQTCVPPRKSPEYHHGNHVNNDNGHRIKQDQEHKQPHYQIHDQPRKQALDCEEAHNQVHEQDHYQASQQPQKQGHDQVHEQAHYQVSQQPHKQGLDQVHEQAHYQAPQQPHKQGHDQVHEQVHYQAPQHPQNQGHDQAHKQARYQAHEENEQVHYQAPLHPHGQGLYQGQQQGHDKAPEQARYHTHDQDISKRKQVAVTEQRHFNQENEENKGAIRDAHNLFEPSYLSRPPPLRLDPAAFEYEPEQESPNQDGPMSYSAVLKAKNEDSFPEPPNRSMAVKLTALTKANTGENIPVQSKQQLSKTASKETNKDTGTSRREPGSRPPPGLPPLPPQNWGQTPELRLTVLPNARRGKPEDAAMSPETEAWRGRQGFGSPPRASGGRGGVSPRGRQDRSRGTSQANNEWQSREPLSWRQVPNDYRKGPREEQVVRPFGPGGQKACFTCGSKEHMSCNDRSKLFFD